MNTTSQYITPDCPSYKTDFFFLQVTITEVNQGPYGACASDSPMDKDVMLTMGAGTEFVIVASLGSELATDVTAKQTADVGTLREQFVSYARTIVELQKMANMSAVWNASMIDTGTADSASGNASLGVSSVLDIPGGGTGSTALACGDLTTVIRTPHTSDVGLVLLAFDVDNLAGTPLTYLLKSAPVRADDGTVAGTVFGWAPPTRNNDTESVTGFTHTWNDDVFVDGNKLSVGDIDTSTHDVPALVFRPAPGINGEVLVKWAARDSLGQEGTEQITTFKVQCPGGEIVNGLTCEQCAPGTYNDRVLLDQTTCTDCPPGTQTPNPGSTRCVACPPDTYTDIAGTGTCGACPASMKSNSGASALTACRCEIGTVQLSNTQCWPCDLLRTKCEVLGRELPIPFRGHWTDPGEPRRTYDCIPSASCVEKFTEDEVRDRRCAGQRFSPLSGDVAYVGDGCYKCQANHYRHAGHCHSCGTQQRARWRLGVLILLYAVVVGLLLEVAGSPAVGALGILVTFLQISASMKYLSIAWPKAMFAWLTVTSASYLDLELWAAECVSPTGWTYFTKYIVAMVQPLAWLFVIFISIFARVARRVMMEYHRRGADAIRTRYNVSRRWLHGQVDPDADEWKNTANKRHGLPLDRPELIDDTDQYTLAEKLDLTNAKPGDFDRVQDYAKYKGVEVDELTIDEKNVPLSKRPLKHLIRIYSLETIERAKPTCMLLFQWGYFLLAQQAVAFFDCESNNDGDLLLRADPSVTCYRGKHLGYLPIALLGLVVYPFGMLAFGFLFIRRYRADGPRPRVNARMQLISQGASPQELKKAENFEHNFGLLYLDARQEWLYWHVVDMGKKLAIVLFRALVPFPISQTLLCTSLLFGVALLAAKAEPFRYRTMNLAEMLSCNVNVLVLIFGYFFQLGIWDEETTVGVAIAANVLIAVTILFLTFAVCLYLFPWIKTFIAMIMNHANAADAEGTVVKLNTSVSGPQGYALFIIPPSSKFRQKCWETMKSNLFDRFIMVAIAMSTVITFVELVPLAPGPRERIDMINDFFTVAFVLEAVLKIIALGFVLGQHAYLRDTFNCLDFVVVLMSVILWIAENGGDALGGIRSARFFKYLKFFKLKYVRFLRIGLQLRNMSGGHVAAIYRKAREPDSDRIKQVMKKARHVFAEKYCEKMHANLRDLPSEVCDGAIDLIEELWKEGYDPEQIMTVSQQLHAVRNNVNPENLETVYEWLAFHAKHGEKTAFLDTMIYSRDLMAQIGDEAVRELMSKHGSATRPEEFTMPPEEKAFAKDVANELRRRKSGRGGDLPASDPRGRNLDIGSFDVDLYDNEMNNHPGMREGREGRKLRHGHGVDSTYQTQEERLAEESLDLTGEKQVKRTGWRNTPSRRRR